MKFLFNAAEHFDHIMSMYEASFYNRDLDGIAGNYQFWLKPGGVLAIETIDPDLLRRDRIGPKTRETQKHAKFSKVGWWTAAEPAGSYYYHEKISFKDGTTTLKKHMLFLPEREQLKKVFAQAGFTFLGSVLSPFFKQELIYFFKKKNRSA